MTTIDDFFEQNQNKTYNFLPIPGVVIQGARIMAIKSVRIFLFTLGLLKSIYD